MGAVEMKMVLGAGVSGLSTAYYLLSKVPSSHITVVEASNRVGGWIKSTPRPGYLFEQGPRTIRPKGEPGANTLQLIEELGLSNQVIPINSSHPAAKNRMIYVKNNLHSLPSTLIQALQTNTPFSRPLVASLMTDLRSPKKIMPANDESIYDFVERRLGKELADYAISPLICGICAGDAKEISVKFLMKSLFEGEQKHGSIVRAVVSNALFGKSNKFSRGLLAKRAQAERWSVYSLEGGLETLPNALEKNLTNRGVDIQLETICSEMIFEKDRAVLTVNGRQMEAEHVFSSLLAKNVAGLVRRQHPRLADDLIAIPTVTVGVVNLQYSRKVISHNAFGFLVPPSENLAILGVIFDSCCFPNGDNTVLTVMMGGRWFSKYFGVNPKSEMLLETALKNVQDILGVKEKPNAYEVNILKDCIPQYTVGHNDRVNRIQDYIKDHTLPLTLCGSSYFGVGVNDVILSAKKAVDYIY